ncbi:hypothetical protein BBJ28_00007332 [Nothophytophthora sp. Chile5]|nr:hypothetical protein BBJ28_00007332 [Nothophytophthora sp. Chile5]
MRSDHLIISGDCGGTNTRLSLWNIPHNAQHLKGNIAPGDAIFAKKYLNEEHASFAEVCHLFMNEAKLVDRVPEACVLACAGPILKNTVDFTNVEFGWKIDGASLEKELGIKVVKLINDFAAMGYGLLTLRPHEYLVMNDVPKEEGGVIATVGAGTGLGECFLTAGSDGAYSCFACEGGHTDFAPANDLEIEIYNDIKSKVREAFGGFCGSFTDARRIISGPGLATIYSFLAKKYPEKVDPKVHEEFLNANTQQGKVIGENAKTNELCNQTLEIFVGAYGREAGNAMLKYLPRGGFYITGGLAPKNLDYFTKKDIFLNSLFDKGRVSPALRECPIYLVLTEELGERGAHLYAYQLLNSTHGDLIISGDCGGTNTRLSLWLIPKGAKSFKGKDSLFTNIKDGWKIDGPGLEKELGITTVKLINDFAAMGYGLLTLKPHEYIVLNDVPREEGAPIATIGAGTGLGECYLTADKDGQYSCFACEGGHTDFAPADALEIEIYNAIKAELGCHRRFSVERIISGPGLATIYKFLAKKFPEKVNEKVHADFQSAKSLQGKIVGDNAKSDELCNQAMEIFVDAYGREAGCAMLKYLPRGGFYITGGLAPKNLDYFTQKDIFLKACFNKGRVSPALRECPIYLVLTEDLGERGAHYYAYQLLQAYNDSLLGNTVARERAVEKYATSDHFALYAAIAAAGAVVGAVVGSALRK